LLVAGLLAWSCSPAPPAANPPTPRVGYERLQEAYNVWQLIDRARDATGQLQSWREFDPETGSSWEFGIPSHSHYRYVGADGETHEGYESSETACWLRADGIWDRRPIGRRPPVAAALADDLFTSPMHIVREGTTEIDGVSVQIVRFRQRPGDRRWSTLATERELRVWLALDDALPRRVEIATPSFQRAERVSVRLLSGFDEPVDVSPPCS
jgi:hypothetical protein